jgi:hypothetical protein
MDNRKLSIAVRLVLICFASVPHVCLCQTAPASRPSALAVPATYRESVLTLLLAEANQIADKLRLPDDLPITREKLTEVHVGPPALNNTFGGPNGSIRTRKFYYSFAFKGKLTSLGRLDLMSHSMLSNEELTAAYKKRAISLSQVDTNAAWAAMQPYLRAGIMDVERLNRECRFELSHLEWGKLHVPIYYAVWTRNGEDVARIKLLMPDKILLALRIEDPDFSLRPGIKLPSTNAPPASNPP